MRRWLTRILVCLVLGAATTVGVAWGLALCGTFDRLTIDDRLETGVWKGLGSVFVYDYRDPERKASDNLPLGSGNLGRFLVDDPELGALDARGWPTLALLSRYRGHSDEYECAIIVDDSPQTMRFGITSHTFCFAPKVALPLCPIWPGFLIDTLFYAAIWFGMFFGLGATRRCLRKKRGCCPMCAYDLRGDLETGCPECGWNRAK